MNLWMSIRRTLIPIVVAAVMASALGPVLDENLVTEFFVALFASVYYVLFRVLEQQGFNWATVFLAGGPAPVPHYDLDTGVLADVDMSEWVATDSGAGATADSE
jgi:hypothetical protein